MIPVGHRSQSRAHTSRTLSTSGVVECLAHRLTCNQQAYWCYGKKESAAEAVFLPPQQCRYCSSAWTYSGLTTKILNGNDRRNYR